MSFRSRMRRFSSQNLHSHHLRVIRSPYPQRPFQDQEPLLDQSTLFCVVLPHSVQRHLQFFEATQVDPIIRTAVRLK